MGEPQVIAPVDRRIEGSRQRVVEQFDLQGTESNELGGDIHRGVHFGDLPGQVITIFLHETETLTVKSHGLGEVGDAEPQVRRLVGIVDILHYSPSTYDHLAAQLVSAGCCPELPLIYYGFLSVGPCVGKPVQDPPRVLPVDVADERRQDAVTK